MTTDGALDDGALDDADPRELGPYRLLARLGGGGMGQVYLGIGPAGLVAVKVVHPWLAHDADFRLRFAREVRTSRRVVGPWTAAVVDADTDAPTPWLATEYVHGVPLDRALAEAGPLPAVSVHVLAADLARALAAVHAAGLVHRDVKPGNVLLTAERPYLIDFGISRALDGTRLTGTGAILGTPAFMAPEQVSGEPLGTAADLFALGAVLVGAATGVGPFGTGSPLAVMRRIRTAEPDLGALAAPVRDLVAGCLRRDPAARPTAAELAELLEPVPAMPRSGWLPPTITALVGPPPSTTARPPRDASAPPAPPTAPDDPDAPTERTTPPGPSPDDARPRRVSRRRLLAGAGAITVAGAVAGIAAALNGGGSPAAAPPVTPQLAWRTQLEGGIRALALDGDRFVYASGVADQLHRLDLATGRPQWTFTLSGPGLATPALVGDRVIVDDGTASYVLDAEQGTLVRDFELLTLAGAGPDVLVASTLDDNGGYLLQGLGLADGQLRWSRQLPEFVVGTDRPSVAVGDTLVVALGPRLAGLDIRTGDVRWWYGDGGSPGSAVALQPVGDVLIATVPGYSGDRIVALDAAFGYPRWPNGVEYQTFGPPAIDRDALYFRDSHTVTCLDLATGQVRWTRIPDHYRIDLSTDRDAGPEEPDWGARGTVIAAADGVCYFGGPGDPEDFFLFALDGGTGATRWFLPVDGSHNLLAPLVATGPTVVNGTEDGAVYAVVSR